MKIWQHLRFVVFAALLIAPLAGGTGKASPSYAATPAATESALSLGQSYTTRNKAFQFNYPDGWIIKEDQSGEIIIGIDQAALDAAFSSDNPVLKPGQAAFVVQMLAPGSSSASSLNASQGGTAMATALVKQSSNRSVKFDAITEAKIGSIAAGRVEFHYKGSEGVLYAFLLDKTPVLTGVLSAPGETANYDDTLMALAVSIAPNTTAPATEATLPATEVAAATEVATTPKIPYQTVIAQDQSFAVNFPPDWVLKDFGGDGLNVVAANSDSVLNDLLNSQAKNFKSYQLAVSVRGFAGKIPDGLDTSGDLTKLVKTDVENLTGIKQHDDIKTYPVGGIPTAWTIANAFGIDLTIFGFFVDKTPFIVTEFSAPGDYTDTDKVYAIIESIKPAEDAGSSAADLSTVDLPTVFTSPLYGGYSANLPKGWVGETDNTLIYMSSSQAALDAVAKATKEPVVKTGQVVLVFLADGAVAGDASNPVDQLGNFIGRLRSPAHFGTVGTYRIGDIFAARTLMTADTYEGAIYLLPLGGGALPVLVLTAPGDFAQQRDTVDAVLAGFKKIPH